MKKNLLRFRREVDKRLSTHRIHPQEEEALCRLLQFSYSLVGNSLKTPLRRMSGRLAGSAFQWYLVGSHVWVFMVCRLGVPFTISGGMDCNQFGTFLFCFPYLDSHVTPRINESTLLA